MGRKTLFFILLCISISSFSNNKDHYSKSKIIKKITMIKMPENGFNIIYEDKFFKFYFNKSLFIEFVKSKNFKYRNHTKEGIRNLNSKKGTVNYYDPLWLINLHPVKYKFDSIAYSAINEDKYLIICDQIHTMVWEYLKEGRFKVFDKRMKSYIQTDYFYLIETETRFPDNMERTQCYQLPNKKILLKILIEAIEEFPFIDDDIQKTENKIDLDDDIK